MELFVSCLYFVLLVGSSYCFHRKFGCLKASLLSGMVTCAGIGAILACSEMKERFSLGQLLAAMAGAIIFGTIFSACLSALIGAAAQFQKKLRSIRTSQPIQRPGWRPAITYRRRLGQKTVALE